MELRHKIFRRIIALLALLIALSSVIMGVYVVQLNRRDCKGKGRELAFLIAQEAAKLISWDDRLAVRELLDHALTVNPHPRYAFVERKGTLYVESPAVGIPPELLGPPDGPLQQDIERTFTDTAGKVFYDIAVRVRGGQAVVHIGLDRAKVDRSALPSLVWLTALGGALFLLLLPAARNASLAITKEVSSMTRRLREANETLEARVAMRTAEIKQLNETLEQRVLERTAQLQAANKELARSNQDLEQFAYAASHDLQEPLRKVMAFGSLLEKEHGEALKDEGRDYIQRMQNATQRMQCLINDLLMYSRVTTRGQAFVPVDLNETVQGVLSDMETRVRETNARVEVTPLPVIEADPTQMRQLLQNLIGNALKFHKKGLAPCVKVSANGCGPESGVIPAGWASHCRITVEDNGIGFDERHKERIFGLFQRLHGRHEYEGTGLGLSVCRRIAERHGGTITATGTEGEGARFTVILPTEHAATKLEA